MASRIGYSVSQLQRCGKTNASTEFWKPTTLLVQRTNPSMASYRAFGTSDKNNSKPQPDTKTSDEPEDESHLNWKDRKEAPRWMQRIAPTKGGKWPPSPQEAVILSAGLAVFVWSWTA